MMPIIMRAPTDFLLIASMMRRINDEAAEDIDPQIPPMLPLGIICKITLQKMLVVAVILTIS
jgi:hypothetical protein